MADLCELYEKIGFTLYHNAPIVRSRVVPSGICEVHQCSDHEVVGTGFTNVKTILASGNVVFHAGSSSIQALTSRIETSLKDRFGFPVTVQVYPFEKISRMIEENPFKAYTSDKNIHWYVTFLGSKNIHVPIPASGSFKCIALEDGVLYSIFDRNEGKSTDFMALLDRTYGKQVTTRNWRTIEKIADA